MHSKKLRGYIVHTDKKYVSVEHRASFRPRTIVLLSAAYLGYCLLPAVRRVLLDFYRSHDPVVAGFALLMLSIPFMSGAGLLFFASGEIMRCDQQELHFAKKRSWGRWHRFRFAMKEIRQLRRTSRGAGSRSRYYTVLTFQHAGRTYDMLENLDPGHSDQILRACEAIGLDVVIGSDNSAAMNRDIAERGWLVNPLKPDEHVAGRKGS
jgi:hypothetical protein